MSQAVSVALVAEDDDASRESARWLGKRLSTFRSPEALVRRGLPRQVELIRAIEDADDLRSAQYLIIICTSASRSSARLAAVVTSFLESHPPACVLPVIAEGSAESSIPQILRADEPLAVTFPTRGRRRHSSEELTRLLATLIGCTFDELRQREHRRRVARRWAYASAMAVVIVAVMVVRFSFRHFATRTGEEIVVLSRGLGFFHPILGSTKVLFDTGTPITQLTREGIAEVRANAACLPLPSPRWLSCAGALHDWHAPMLLGTISRDQIWNAAAFRTLVDMGDQNAALRALLLRRVPDCNQQVSSDARQWLERLGATSAESNAAFERRRRCGPEVLPTVIPPTAPVSERVANLRAMLRDPAKSLYAAQQLIDLGDKTPDLESVIAPKMTSADRNESFVAAKLLLRLKPDDRAAQDRMWAQLKATFDPNMAWLSVEAADALTAVKTTNVDADAVEILVARIAAGGDAAPMALRALEHLRIRHPLLTAKRETLLWNSSREVRFSAAQSLLALDPSHAEARAELNRLLTEPDAAKYPFTPYGAAPLFARAADALRQLPRGRDEVAATLRARLQDQDLGKALEAARLLADRAENRDMIASVLVPRLPEMKENDLLRAADILLGIPSARNALVPVLERAVELEVHPPPVTGMVPPPPGGPDQYDFAERLAKIRPLSPTILSLLREALERGGGWRAEGYARAVLLRPNEPDNTAIVRLLGELSSSEAAASASYRTAVVIAIALVPNQPEPDAGRARAVERKVAEWAEAHGPEERAMAERIVSEIQRIATRGQHYLR